MNLQRELWMTRVALAFTLAASMLLIQDLWKIAVGLSTLRQIEGVVFTIIVIFLIYGNVCYQLTRLGHLKRMLKHAPPMRDQTDQLYKSHAPALSILVPSYLEEPSVVRQTLLSAALQNYPNRRITLLLDDPPRSDPSALSAINAMHDLVRDLNARFGAMANRVITERDRFNARQPHSSDDLRREAATIARLYGNASDWLDALAGEVPPTSHTDTFFNDRVLKAPAEAHHQAAAEWAQKSRDAASDLTAREVALAYDRLIALFWMKMTAFERKRYANLSHEPNKAMNLNSYIALLGQSYREVRRPNGIHLEHACAAEATLSVPAAEYLITLDADSLLLPEYALRLVSIMEQPGNERIAVAQTPYSAIPNAASTLERIAGATTDIQYLIHQGFTHHNATFWVGANAVLRHAALCDIAEDDRERGHPIRLLICAEK